MIKDSARGLWNNAVGTSFGGDWGGEFQANVLGGAALAFGLSLSLQLGQLPHQIKERKAVAQWLREWADAIEPPEATQ